MKLRVALATAAFGAVALIGLTGCGPADASNDLTASNDLSPQASALSAAFGLDPYEVTTDVPAAEPTPSASPGAARDPGAAKDKGGKHPGLRALKLRRALGPHVEHGEVVVQTKDGDKTVDVQRGTVTAINDTSVTVKSADGFTQTWVFGTPFHVIERRTSIQANAVAVGTQVGVAGIKNGATVTANLLVIPGKK
jgi:hypothetical protein